MQELNDLVWSTNTNGNVRPITTTQGMPFTPSASPLPLKPQLSNAPVYSNARPANSGGSQPVNRSGTSTPQRTVATGQPFGLGKSSSLTGSTANNGVGSNSNKANADDVFGTLVGAFGGASIRQSAAPILSMDEQRKQSQQQLLQRHPQNLSSGNASNIVFPVNTAQSLMISHSTSLQPLVSAGKPPSRSGSPSLVPVNAFDGLGLTMGTSNSQHTRAMSNTAGATAQSLTFNAANGISTQSTGIMQFDGISSTSRLSPAYPSNKHQDSTSNLDIPTLQPHQLSTNKIHSKSPSATNSSKQSAPFADLLSIKPSASKVSQMTVASQSESTLPQSKQTGTMVQPPKSAEAWGNIDFLDAPGPAKHTSIATSGNYTTVSDTHLVNGDIFDASFLGSQFSKETKVCKPVVDDNPLGLLAGPATQSPAWESLTLKATQSTSPTHSLQSNSQSLPISQPTKNSNDRNIAQIVSMGFDADSAAAALEVSGQEVAAAIDILVQNQKAEAQIQHFSLANQGISPTKSQRQTTSCSSNRPESKFNSDNNTDEYKGFYTGRARDEDDIEPGSRVLPDTQKIIESASAFGMSVFKNAKTFVSYSKKAITQVIEKAGADVSGTSTGETKSPGGYDENRHAAQEYSQWNGKPFKDHDDGEYDDCYDAHDAPKESKFSDGLNTQNGHGWQNDTTDMNMSVSSDEDVDVSVKKQTNCLSAIKSEGSSQQVPSSKSDNNLIDPDGFVTISPPAPSMNSTMQQFLETELSQPSKQQTPFPSTRQQPKLQSSALTTSPHYISAESTKSLGTEMFKKGQFSDAVVHYTTAIQALQALSSSTMSTDPAYMSLLVTLLTNRASAMLKTGQYREAIADCTQALGISSNDLKGLHRRACAYEAIEMWTEALKDYRMVMETGGASKSVSEGIVRCNKALQGSDRGTLASETNAINSSASVSQPKLVKPSSVQVQSAVDAAVQKLRHQAIQAEQEETEKFALGDEIEAKINHWRRNKEDNLRALISTLNMVLWPSLGWKPVGLGELVTPQQLKVRYMRAVGKVHPDKLGVDATVEQRLIANHVFSTLNKAWDLFKASNGIS
ncbi:auxilin-like clathrin-binding protein required for normal clathrin function [Batrachochytrium dendrobatidis]|nr:auxilin-like clathrin-binding protein required for normal clathrin function [Batrachochytrium dendrobatidis]